MAKTHSQRLQRWQSMPKEQPHCMKNAKATKETITMQGQEAEDTTDTIKMNEYEAVYII